MRYLLSCLITMAMSPLCSGAEAAALQALNDIQHAAEQQVLAQLPKDQLKHHIIADRLDERLRLPACKSGLQSSLPYATNPGAKVTVAVRCTDVGGWNVYVPVAVETEITSLVLKYGVARGSSISAADVEVRTQRVTGMGSAFVTDIQQLTGVHTRRDLNAGTILTPALLEADLLVKRGQQVMLLASAGGIEVRSQGIALTDGSANERIRVKNLSSAKVVEGVVDSDSQVRVQL
jgi:flagellar basal body P-ring formation protein FlgA